MLGGGGLERCEAETNKCPTKPYCHYQYNILCCCWLQFMDRTNPVDKHLVVLADKYGIASSPITPQMFASAGKEHMEKYGEITCTHTHTHTHTHTLEVICGSGS